MAKVFFSITIARCLIYPPVKFFDLRMVSAMSIFVATLSMSLGSIRAARFLHSKMLTHILRSPMSFFDTTPLGRIVNRFSKDIDSIDYAFPATLRTFMNCVFEVNIDI